MVRLDEAQAASIYGGETCYAAGIVTNVACAITAMTSWSIVATLIVGPTCAAGLIATAIAC